MKEVPKLIITLKGMKKLLLAAITSLFVIGPAVAGGPVTRSENCFRNNTCEGKSEIEVLDDYVEELQRILDELEALQVKAYFVPKKYWHNGYRGLYLPDKNIIYINDKFKDDQVMLLRILRHEAWHVAQDCMGGTIANSKLLHIIPHTSIHPEITADAIDRYGTDPYTIRIEREALLATNTPGLSVSALETCNSEYKMWEEYDPPERTRSWLYINGYL